MAFRLAAIAGIAAVVAGLTGCGGDVSEVTLDPQPGATTTEGADTTQSAADVRAGRFGMRHTDLTVDQVRAFKEFPVVWLGESFQGLNLTSILRDDYLQEQPTGYEPVPVNALSLVYGSCTASADTGCAPPLEIQIWPKCLKPLSETDVPQADHPELDVTAGLPSLHLVDHIELATGSETVLVFGDSDALREAAAEALRYVGNPDATLAAPVPGVLRAGEPCR